MNNEQECAWPPPYTVRLSAKSKRLSLRISSSKGLEVVVPKRTSSEKVVNFLNSKYDWVQKHRNLLIRHQDRITLPDTLDLQAIGQIWQLRYGLSSLSKQCVCSEAAQTLLLKEQKESVPSSFIKVWIKKKAQKHLPDIFNRYSEQYDLPYQGLSFRFQKTRWGSCSKDKNISLNCKLLLLPQAIVHYIMVHELIHTIHFDHSRAFWNAVEKIIPEHEVIRSQLKNVELQLPSWLY